MNPEQPAARSKAAAPAAPRLLWTMQAVAGIGMSGVTVAHTIRSMSEADMRADSSASCAARVANCDMYSSARAMRRSRIPVRDLIQSSEVSTIFSRSALVSTRDGSAEPVPRMTARLSLRAIQLLRRHRAAARERRARSGRRRDPEDLVVDPIVDPVAHEVQRDPYRVLDGARRRPAVTDDRRRTHAQKRHASVLGVVDFLAKIAERRSRQDIAHFREERLGDLLFHEVQDRLRGALHRLQRHVADEAVADDDVRLAVEDVAALHVADEVQGGFLEHPERLAGHLVSLGVLLPDAHQSDAGAADAQHLAAVEMAHDGELHQVLRPAVD